VFHYGGQNDRLARFSRQQETIEQIRNFNGCSEQSESCGANCVLYPSAKGRPFETFIHPLGHFHPPQVTPLIVKLFQERPRSS